MEIQEDKRMIHDLFTSHSAEWKGALGVVLSVVFPIVNEYLDLLHKGFAIVGAFGGICLLVYSIDVKRMERDKLQEERNKRKKRES